MNSRISQKRARELAEKEMAQHQATDQGSLLKQVILGGQDGLVNVLGVLLGVASATSDAGIVIIAGLAATFAESISMAAVAYASARAGQDYYEKQLENEWREIEELPEVEREEIRLIYMKKGFRGRQLEQVVKKITSEKKVWVEVMMKEELGLSEEEHSQPVREGIVVGGSALVGSFVPMIPFFFLPIREAMAASFVVSLLTLFFAGAYKAKITVGSWLKSGVEMSAVGMLAALAGYAVGALLGAKFVG